jgi:hypothetical protein
MMSDAQRRLLDICEAMGWQLETYGGISGRVAALMRARTQVAHGCGDTDEAAEANLLSKLVKGIMPKPEPKGPDSIAGAVLSSTPRPSQLERDLGLIGRWIDTSGDRSVEWSRCGDGSHEIKLLHRDGDLTHLSGHGPREVDAVAVAAAKLAAKQTEMLDRTKDLLGDWTDEAPQ